MDITYDCLEWDGRLNQDFYGLVPIEPGPKGGRTMPAHRWVWEGTFGPIPVGVHVLHRCDNPPCINIDHLFLGTNADNIADKIAKGRQARGGGQRKLTGEQVRSIRERLEQGETSARLAREFGVSRVMMGHIKARRSWKSLTGNMVRDHSCKLTVAQVWTIRDRLTAGESCPDIANDFGVSSWTVRAIESGKRWAWLTERA